MSISAKDETIELGDVCFVKREARVAIGDLSILVVFDYWCIVSAHRWHQESRWTLSPSDGYRPFVLDEKQKLAIVAALKVVHAERELDRKNSVPTERERIDAAIATDRSRREFDRESQRITEAALRKLKERQFEIGVDRAVLPNPHSTVGD